MEEGKYCLNRCRKFNKVTLLPPRILLIISFQVSYLESYCVCFHSCLTMVSKKKLVMSYYLRSDGESDLNEMKHQRQTHIMITSSFCLVFNILMKKNLERNQLLGQNCAFFFFSCSTVVSVFYWVIHALQLPFSLSPSASKPSQFLWWIFALEEEHNISRQSDAGITVHSSDDRRVFICRSLHIQCLAGDACSTQVIARKQHMQKLLKNWSVLVFLAFTESTRHLGRDPERRKKERIQDCSGIKIEEHNESHTGTAQLPARLSSAVVLLREGPKKHLTFSWDCRHWFRSAGCFLWHGIVRNQRGEQSLDYVAQCKC